MNSKINKIEKLIIQEVDNPSDIFFPKSSIKRNPNLNFEQLVIPKFLDSTFKDLSSDKIFNRYFFIYFHLFFILNLIIKAIIFPINKNCFSIFRVLIFF